MYLIENPVLQRELLVNLRMSRGFVLMLFYQGLLAALVYLAWPAGSTTRPVDKTGSRSTSWSTCSFWGNTCWRP